MKKIFIIGSGGFAKEVAMLAMQIGYHINAFIDIDKGSDVKVGNKLIPIIKEDVFLKEYKDVNIAIGVGNPKIIKKISIKFSQFSFPNLIHPTAQFDENYNTIGKGNIITSNVIFTTNIKVSDFNIFNLSSTIGHDTIIENFNVINPLVAISGGVKIGNGNMFGVSSTILQYLNIGDNNIIGASSLITKDITSNLTLIGVPAKIKE